MVSFRVVAQLGNNVIRWASKMNPFARRLVTLAIEDDGMNLVVFRGNEIQTWNSLPLDTEVIKDSCIVNPIEFGRLIHNFMKQNGVNNKKVMCSISGYHSLARIITLPKLSSSVIYEAIGREAARAMPTDGRQIPAPARREPRRHRDCS